MKMLHQDASREAYKFICIWVFGIWFGYVLFDPMMSLADYPRSIYFPAGFLLKFLPSNFYYLPISLPFLFSLKILLIVAIAAVLIGFHKKWSALVTCILLTVFEGIVRSFGHINHPEMPLLLSVFVLTIFFFFEDKIEINFSGISKFGIPLIAILFIISFTYCFAGIHRLIVRGFDIYSTNTIVFWVIEEGKRSRMLNWHMEDLMLTNPFVNLLMRVGFPLVTLGEITAPFCLVSRTFRRFWLLLMVPFHIMVWVFMGIFFWANLALYILFIDLTLFLENRRTPWTAFFKSL